MGFGDRILGIFSKRPRKSVPLQKGRQSRKLDAGRAPHEETRYLVRNDPHEANRPGRDRESGARSAGYPPEDRAGWTPSRAADPALDRTVMRSGGQFPPPPESQRPFGATPAPNVRTPLPLAPSESEGSDHTVYEASPLARDSRVAGLLLAVEGKLLGQVFRIFEGETVLGRGSTLSDPFPDGPEWDKKISREHAKVVSSQGNFLIQSLKPDQNPTLVNGEAVPEGGLLLEDKSRIQMGRSTFVFLAVPVPTQ